MANENNNVASFNIVNTPSMIAGANIPEAFAAVTIATNGITSSSVNLNGEVLIGLITAVTWTAADLTLQASIDNSTFYDVYDSYGNEILIKTTAFTTSSKFIPLSPIDYVPFSFLRFRSGTSTIGVTQTGARTITLITRTV